MRLNSSATPIGHIQFTLSDEHGVILQQQTHNTVTALGKQHIADRLAAIPTQAVMGNMAIGTGTPSTTALGTEISRKALVSRTASGAVITYVARWDNDDEIAATITEVGIFNTPTLGGVMLASGKDFTPIVKAAKNTLTLTWSITIT